MTFISFADALAGNDFATFTLTPGVGLFMSLSSIPAYNVRRSGTGPTIGRWQYQVGAAPFVDLGSDITWGGITSAAGNAQAAIDLSIIPALQLVPSGTTVTFRLVLWGGTGASGTWYLNDPTGTPGIDFEVRGTLVVDLTTDAITGAPFALASCAATASGTVDYSSVSTVFTGNTFSVQLSDAVGDFTGAPTIGTLVSDASSGTINITLPAGTPSGAGYRMRVVSSSPALVGVQSAAFTVTQSGISCSSSPLDFFRSQASGSWSTAAIWQSSSDNATWITSTISPTLNAASVLIRSTDSIRVTDSRSSNNLTVQGALATVTGGLFTASGTNAFTAGARYYHEIDGGAIPLATWNATSTCEVRGMVNTGPANVGQNFGDFIWNNTGQATFININNASFGTQGIFYMRSTGTFNLAFTGATTTSYTYQLGGINQLGGTLNLSFIASATAGFTTLQVSGDVSIQNGIFSFGAGGGVPPTPTDVGILELGGNLTVTSTASFYTSSTVPNALGRVVCNAAGAQSISVAPALNRGKVRYTIASGSVTTLLTHNLEFGTTNQLTVFAGGILEAGDRMVLNNGTVTIEGTLRTTNVNGVIGSGATIGSGVTLAAMLPGATIVYNRAGNQVVSTTGITYRNLTITGSGNKTAAGTVNIDASTLLVQSGPTFRLSGVAGENLNLNNTSSLLIDAGATFDNQGESQITGTSSPTVTINGRFITRDAQGFTGTGAAIPGIVPVLGGASTIEYGRAGDQQLQDAAYHNLTFSGSGIKTTTTIATITGTVTMADNVTVQASNFTLGGVGTNLTMTGSARFITAGTGVKPDMTGTYTLAPTTTIEFTNTNTTLQSIRIAPLYANLDINGTQVGTTAGSGLGLQSGCTFTVRSGAAFRFTNANGFSGAVNTAISNINSPAILLQPNSTVVYNASGPQVVTNASAYQNLTLMGSGNKTLAGFTNVEGMLTIEGTAVLGAGTHTLQLSRDWNSTTLAASFLPGTGTVVLNGAVAQTVSATNGSVDFHILTINNSSTGVSLVNTHAFIAQQLNLTDGTLFAPNAAAARVELAAGATQVGGSAASHVEGWCRKVGNTAFTFPLGRSGAYAPVGISAPSLATDHFTATYFQGSTPYDVTQRDATLERIGNCEHWEINRTNGASSVAITLPFDAARSCGINVEADLRLARWDGSQWRDMGVASLDIPGQTITSPAISTFSPFTLGSTSIFNPLPVQLEQFYAVQAPHRQVTLHWRFLEESTLLMLERSIDGITWEALGTGNRVAEGIFVYADKLSNPVQYYRLSQTAENTASVRVVSRVIALMGEAAPVDMGVYPNPTSGVVRLYLPHGDDRLKQVALYGPSGVGLHTYDCTTIAEAERWLQNTLSEAEAGMWYLVLHTETMRYRTKVVVQR